MLATGIKKEELAQLREAQDALHRMIDEARAAEAAAAVGLSELLVARAILWAEMGLVAAVARAELSEERWRLYQQASLLEMAPRGPERRARPEGREQPPAAEPPAAETPAAETPAAGTPAAGTPQPAPPLAARRDVVPPGASLLAVPPGGREPLPVTLLPDGTLVWAAPVPGTCRASRTRRRTR